VSQSILYLRQGEADYPAQLTSSQNCTILIVRIMQLMLWEEAGKK